MEELICVMCGTSEGAFECIDPYAQDVHNEEIETVLCDECYQIFCDDI